VFFKRAMKKPALSTQHRTPIGYAQQQIYT